MEKCIKQMVTWFSALNINWLVYVWENKRKPNYIKCQLCNSKLSTKLSYNIKQIYFEHD